VKADLDAIKRLAWISREEQSGTYLVARHIGRLKNFWVVNDIGSDDIEAGFQVFLGEVV
jgi:hypothetical protein